MTGRLLSLGEIGPLESEWGRMAELRGNAFLAPEWIRPWHRHFGEGVELAFAVLPEPGGGLRGLLPIAFHRGRPRTARVAGASMADYVHPLCRLEHEEETAAAVGEALRPARRRWPVLALEQVEESDGPWVSALADATGIPLSQLRGARSTLPLIDIASHGSFEDYLAAQSRGFRKERVRNLRRARRRHELSFRWTRTAEQLEADMATMFRLHELRFGEKSSLDSERARAFHLEFAAGALRRGWLRLAILEFDGRPVAAEYSWSLGRRFSFFNGGFDPAYAELSPGSIIRNEVIEAAFEEGAREFDFMLGDEPYKRRYADRGRTVRNHVLVRRGHPLAAAVVAEQTLRRLWRHMPDSVRRRVPAGRPSLIRARAR